jgi:hypothetical protein
MAQIVEIKTVRGAEGETKRLERGWEKKRTCCIGVA